MKLPEKFVDKMYNILNSDIDKFLQSLEEENIKALTVDNNKVSIDKLEDVVKLEGIKLEPIPYVNNGYYYNYPQSLAYPLNNNQNALEKNG